MTLRSDTSRTFSCSAINPPFTIATITNVEIIVARRSQFLFCHLSSYFIVRRVLSAIQNFDLHRQARLPPNTDRRFVARGSPALAQTDEIPARIIDVPQIYGVSRERSSAKLFHIDFQVGWRPRYGTAPRYGAAHTRCPHKRIVVSRRLFMRGPAFPPFPLDV